MLTPVDIQQKRFKSGLGFDKKDVSSFFEEVSKSYGELYRSNAELKEKVITLTDTVQHYRVKEEDLNKTLLRAEKNSQESLSNAVKNAKSIEMEATAHANEIVKEARAEKERLEVQIVELRRKYNDYKSQYMKLVNKHLNFLEDNDFDENSSEAYKDDIPSSEPNEMPPFDLGSIDPQFSLNANTESPGSSGSGSSGSGSGGGMKLSIKGSQSNSMNVYGSTLGGDGINPFGE